MRVPVTALLDQAAARWDALARSHPELQPAIDLQRQLLAEIVDVLARLDRTHPAPALPSPGEVADRLRRGVPVLRAAPITAPAHLLAPSLDRFCRQLAEGGAGDVARHLLETFEAGRLNRGSLLGASLARSQQAIERGATQMGLSPDLVWLVAELATAPFAHALQHAVLASADPDVGEALAAWDRGYCPACGSWPALAELVGTRRMLRCSYCAAAWELRGRRCIYCGDAGDGFVVSAPDPARPEHELECCTPCGGYTKALRVEAPAPFPLVAVEDLESFELDRIAAAGGYGRPPLADLGEAAFELPRACEGELT
jgi:FdhE protein